MKVTRDPITLQPMVVHQGFKIVLKDDFKTSELPNFFKTLSAGVESLSELERHHSGVECVLTRSGEPITAA